MLRTKKPKVILTNDPSMTAWGYCIIDLSGEIIQANCIKTEPDTKKNRIRKGDTTVRRISEINSILIKLFNKYEILLILSELPHGSQNASAAVMIGMVAGIMQTIADVLNIPIEWYSENDAKKSLFNQKSISKQEMIKRIAGIYDVPWYNIKYKDEAIADALAIYHVAVQTSSSLKLLKQIQ